MTAQEAYAELISIRKNREDGYLTHLSYSGKADEQEEYTIKAYSVALNALEKQIPKKPINEECYYICPCCRDMTWVFRMTIFLSMNFRCLNIAVIADVYSTGRR